MVLIAAVILQCALTALVWGKDVMHQPVPGRPQTDDKLMLSDSYLPASMQVIAYLTDLMKYDIAALSKPQPVIPQATTKPPAPKPSTAPAPTQPHGPGVVAPEKPPTTPKTLDPSKYSKLNTKPQYNNLYSTGEDRFPKEIEYLADAPKQILEQINQISDYDIIGEDNEFHLERFSVNYDDDVRELRLPAKRTPPTRAYVELLSLYDALNKEAKRQGFARFNGYSKKLLDALMETSSGTANDQLKHVLSKMLERQESKRTEANNKAKKLVDELSKADSVVTVSIRYYQPMQFSV